MEVGASWLLAALGFAVAMSGTPGPNNAMVAASGANFGLRRSLPHMLGVTLGFPAMLLAVALGAGEALRAAPGLHAALRWAGAAWLLVMAWRIATAAPEAPGAAPRGAPMSFLAAAAFQWVNPKAWVIALAAFAAYTTPGAAVAQAAVLALLFALVTLPLLAGWALLGVASARLLGPSGLRWFNRAMALLLVLSLLPLLG
ncbi:LysE family translocator [Roseococcus sp. DSY-14]|uniref:LysE family translocator n=1 Tax=Roseococcus sp. DSY-14 TaxID=3369650 RepID=UPI00387B277C